MSEEPIITEQDEDGEWVIADTDDDDDALLDELIDNLPETDEEAGA